MTLLKTINSELNQAAIILDQITHKIQMAPELDNKENILLIAQAMSNIFLIQKNIYEHCPELKNSLSQND
ncbi:hypothetical protein [Acinetobacter sp. 161(2023)]|uniref:hypothetical protein n=1 Tax=Acinetobacter sp. 161(2023) TaxID=3098768 RepID=UPI00300B66CB